MESLIDLFNPCDDCAGDGPPDKTMPQSSFSQDTFPQDSFPQGSFPPEPEAGNVEYKLKIVNPSKQRFEHLVTQMKWRLREGQGEAIYVIGVEDNGELAGLLNVDMVISLQTLEEMATKLGATTHILREREVDDERHIVEVLVRKVPDDQNNIEVRVAVLGSAEAGKSTLLGVLTQGSLDNGRGRARLNMFRHVHEVQSGRTSSISHEILGFNSHGQPVNYGYNDLMTAEEICDQSTKLVTFLDLAGHKKYIRTTIQGLSGYSPHYAMFVISSAAGADGMTHEHLTIAVALNVPFFIVLTKIDLASPINALQSLETLLKQVGSSRIPLVVKNLDDVITAGANQLNQNVVPIFCVSSVTAEGLDNLLKFLHVLPPGMSVKERERLERESPEFQIDEKFKAGDAEQVLGGLLVKGVISEGSPMQIGPLKDGSFKFVRIKSIHRNRVPSRFVRAGQSAAVRLETSVTNLRNGMVLIGADMNATACLYFQASISVLFHKTAIYSGFQSTVHIGNIRQAAVICSISPAECIHTDERASVVFKFKNRPELVRVGQRILFRSGFSKGIGEITKVIPLGCSHTKY